MNPEGKHIFSTISDSDSLDDRQKRLIQQTMKTIDEGLIQPEPEAENALISHSADFKTSASEAYKLHGDES